jgi:hypothetical protein
MSSPDGITWTLRTSASNEAWSSVTYGNGLFAAVAATGVGNRVMTSPDGITWTLRTSAADNTWSSVTYGNGLFVAVATTGTGNRVMTSGPGTNEEQTLSITGTPTKGSVTLTIVGHEVVIPFDATAGEAETLIQAAIGSGNCAVTGGDLPGSDLVIEFLGAYAGTDIADSSIDDADLDGHARLDWRRELNYVLLKAGTYTPTIDLGDVLPSQTIRLAVETDSVTGSPSLAGTDFGDEGAPTLPGDGSFDLYELTAIDADTIVGRTIQTGCTP